jgi:hypothetical protein
MDFKYLEELECAASEEKHFIIDPITLPNCGHSVCKNCLLKEKSNSIKCNKCGVTTEDFSKFQITKGLKEILKLCLGNMLRKISLKIGVWRNLKNTKKSFLVMKGY